VARARSWVAFAPPEAGWEPSRDPAWVQAAVRGLECCCGGGGRSTKRLGSNASGEAGSFSALPHKNYTQPSPLHEGGH